MYTKKLSIENTVITGSVYDEYMKKFSLLEEKLNTIKTTGFKNISLKKYDEVLRINNPYVEMIKIIKEKLKTEYITNAWIKMREILQHFGNNFSFDNCMFIAEFPGSFIKCVEFYTEEKKLFYNWRANSYKEMKGKKSFYLHDKFKLYETNPYKWFFGSYNNGDITRLETIRSIKQDLLYDDICDAIEIPSVKSPQDSDSKKGVTTNKPDVKPGSASSASSASSAYETNITFMTGDAKVVTFIEGTNEVDWDEEKANVTVIYSETIFVLTLLKQGGSAVIKFFTFLTKETIFIIWNISKYFKTVYVVKPLTSRPANAEMYLICIEKNKTFNEKFLYEISDNPFLHLHSSTEATSAEASSAEALKVPDSFLKELYEIAEHFANLQIEALKINLSLKIIKYEHSIINDWLDKNLKI